MAQDVQEAQIQLQEAAYPAQGSNGGLRRRVDAFYGLASEFTRDQHYKSNSMQLRGVHLP